VTELDRLRLAAARLWGATRFPYLASALFAANVLPSYQRGLVAVDERWHIYIDPHLVVEWRASQLGSVLVHHVGHLLRDHALRARNLGIDKDQATVWTLAADAEINDDLVGAGLDLPQDPVLPSSLGFEAGRFAEEYFRRIPLRESARDCGSGCDAVPREWDQQDGRIDQNLAHLLRCQVAGEVLKSCRGLLPGTVPVGLRRWAETVLGARIDWRKALAAEIRRGVGAVTGAVDYSYRRPSRRAAVIRDVIMPSLFKPIPEVAVVVDTSGSMDERILGQALAEIDGLMRTLGMAQRQLRVIACDAAVHRVQRVTATRQIELLGGGGTNMGEGIAAAERLHPRPSVAVVLTDGFTPWPVLPPKGLRVIVGLLRSGGMQPPAWARVVRMDEAA
jgi:predicted metal-dependent peptidase